MRRRYLLFFLVVLALFAASLRFSSTDVHHVWQSLRSVGEVFGVLGKTAEAEGIRFVGDVMLGRHVERLMQIHGFDYPFARLPDLPDDYLWTINFEASVPQNHVPTPDYGFQFSVKEEVLPFLQAAGVTHASLANNHSYDHGEAGYHHTLAVLGDHDIVSFGGEAGIAFFDIDGVRVALIGIEALDELPPAGVLEHLFTQAKRDAEYQVVFIHWGTEYSLRHSRFQEQSAQVLIAHGADLIIGHHPHVVQDIDRIDGVVVFYSLGNFIFDQYFSTDVQQGLMVDLRFSEQAAILTLHGVTSETSPSQPQILQGRAEQAFFEELAKRSDAGLAASIASQRIVSPW